MLYKQHFEKINCSKTKNLHLNNHLMILIFVSITYKFKQVCMYTSFKQGRNYRSIGCLYLSNYELMNIH